MTEPDIKREIYLLRPDQLSQEAIAVTFAKTSRSPLSFREIAAELTDRESAEFHEKWVVGYGHASVAEHAVLHLAFENISRLAIETIESNRLASYTEKSTRYQQWQPRGYCLPPEIQASPFGSLYIQTCDQLFETYLASLDRVKQVVQRRHPQKAGEAEAAWDSRIRSRYVDACRFILPAAALANVGMTANARTLEHAIRKMLSSPLQEVREIGAEVKRVAQEEVPTLVKYAEAIPYLQHLEQDLNRAVQAVPPSDREGWMTLLNYNQDGEALVLAGALYPYTSQSMRSVLDYVQSLEQAEFDGIAQRFLGSLDHFDTPPRALEHALYSVEAMMDQGAYFELKRHRMMTQTPQRMTGDLGYAIPRLIEEADFLDEYRRAMDQAQEAYQHVVDWNPAIAAYLIPNGFNRRVFMSFNLREAFHFCELRAAPNAHFSIRRVAFRLAELIREVHPTLATFMRLPENVNLEDITQENFTQV